MDVCILVFYKFQMKNGVMTKAVLLHIFAPVFGGMQFLWLVRWQGRVD